MADICTGTVSLVTGATVTGAAMFFTGFPGFPFEHDGINSRQKTENSKPQLIKKTFIRI
jgi:hypothetical protein